MAASRSNSVPDAAAGHDIRCIFFSEFHATLGPQLVYQDPPNFVTQDLFTLVEKYIITKPELCGRLVSVNVRGLQIVGFPVDIPGEYARNHLLFSIALVLDENCDVSVYQPVVRKLAGYLTTLEVESGFIANPVTKASLQGVIERVRADLNESGECVVPVSDLTNTIRLRLLGAAPQLKQAFPHMVPIRLHESAKDAVARVDLTAARLLSYTDGVSVIKRIAQQADVDLASAIVCFQCLDYKGLVTLSAPFQFSSVYVGTAEITRLYRDKELQQQCIRFTAIDIEDNPPEANQLIKLYCDLMPRVPLMTAFCEKHNPHLLGIDVRRFVQFGLINQLLRQLSRFPLRDISAPYDPASDPDLKAVASLLDGQHSTDEVCCEMGMSPKQLDDILDTDPYTITFRK